MASNKTNTDNNGISSDQGNSQDASESEIKVGNVKDIQQSDMVSISKDYNKIKSAEVSVNSNFLFLRAGANALLAKTGPKRKPPPKKTVAESDKKEEKKYDSPGSSDGSKSKPKVEKSPFYCHVCEVELNSEATYMTHIEGKKHQKKLDTMEIRFPKRAKKTEKLQYMKIKEGCRIPRLPKPNAQPHMKEAFDNIKEPRLGLNFISEIWMFDDVEDTYYCSLCAVTCSANAIVSHIVGFKHRLAYMKLYDPENYEQVKYLQSKKSELTACLLSHAVKLEKRDGPGKVKVEVEIDDERDYDNYEEGPMSEMPLNPRNLHFLPSALKLRFMDETLPACEEPPLYVTEEHIEKLNAALQTLKASVARYSVDDNMMKKRVLSVLEQCAKVEKMQDIPDSWKNMLSSNARNDFIRGVGPMEPMGGPDYMYDGPGRSTDVMGQQFGPMNRSNYPMNMRQGGFRDDSMDIPPFPYGSNQSSAQSYREMWAPMAGVGRNDGGYNPYAGPGGHKRLYSERD